MSHNTWARDVKDGSLLPLVWKNPDVMAYFNAKTKFLDAGKLGALLSKGRTSNTLPTSLLLALSMSNARAVRDVRVRWFK